ncbi:uncharacterized protein LOC106072816 [Biomphalaria glabrata]|uniref:Uncharacterized protein LOC106072816 n=1 Tax=Biomphalaria glabrata TaxID=6526 RepID=A0A9W3A4L3_BIOGL|nr:uncharacterized protein LOC106072816 [Biomphalaria glabrata]
MDPGFCSLHCFDDCNSATYSEQHGTCTTFKEKFYDPSVQWAKDQSWCMLYRKEPIQYGEWTLAFRAQSGINISFYNLWETNGYHNDLSLSSDYPIGCYRMDNLETCTRHFRSSVLDNWTNIDKVRVSLFTDGVQAAYMVFNGTSTNRQSWYSQKLVIDSSWTSLKNDNAVAHFDFLGAPDPESNRPMSIFNAYDICTTDTMYFMVMDKFNDGCLSTWSLVITKFPAFVYSGLNHMVTLAGQDYKIADVMAIFVSLAT